MDKNIEDEVKMIDAHVQGEPEEEIYHVYTVPGGVVILRQGEIPEDQTATVIDSLPKTEPETNIPSTPLPTKQHPEPVTTALLGVLLFGILVPIFCIAVQISFIMNPFTVNVTLAARSQQVSLSGTLQQGRVLNPITVSQSATVPTTGHAHQNPKAATGTVTFYNGQLTSVFIPAGTTLSGSSGVQIITDQDANIPAANPPTWGITTVSAHAVNTGSSGNIAAYDINQGCCATAIKAVNTTLFNGGQDERDYQTVTKTDISNASAPLKTTVTQGSNAALQGQLKANEAITTPSCTTTTTADHQPGEEATTVKVSVSETCSAVAYNQDTLQSKVTQLLTAQAAKKLEPGYSVLGDPQITVTSATPAKHVTLSFTSVSTWIYALSSAEQNHIKKIIAGKTKEQAIELLSTLPGIESVKVQSSGFGDDTRMPKYTANIRLVVIYV